MPESGPKCCTLTTLPRRTAGECWDETHLGAWGARGQSFRDSTMRSLAHTTHHVNPNTPLSLKDIVQGSLAPRSWARCWEGLWLKGCVGEEPSEAITGSGLRMLGLQIYSLPEVYGAETRGANPNYFLWFCTVISTEISKKIPINFILIQLNNFMSVESIWT